MHESVQCDDRETEREKEERERHMIPSHGCPDIIISGHDYTYTPLSNVPNIQTSRVNSLPNDALILHNPILPCKGKRTKTIRNRRVLVSLQRAEWRLVAQK